MGKLKHFEIVYTNGIGVFEAGSVISGEVQLTLDEPMKMKSIKLLIVGKGKVHWYPSRDEAAYIRGKSFKEEEMYLNHEFTFYGDESSESSMHPSGIHKYRFELQVPPTTPSSFEGGFGYVRYWCKATIDRPWRFNHDTKNPFTLIRHVDLNHHLEYRGGGEYELKEDICCSCCVMGEFASTFEIKKRGYVPGEYIEISGDLANAMNASVTKVGAILEQKTSFYGRPEYCWSDNAPLIPKEVTRKVAVLSMGSVGANQKRRWDNAGLKIPPIPSTDLPDCRIISVEYFLTIFVRPRFCKKREIYVRIFIGTRPFSEVETRQPMGAGYSIAPSAPMQGGYQYGAVGGATGPPIPYQYTEPTAPLKDGTVPPPSYESCVFGSVGIRDDSDSNYTRGRMDYAPQYPTYNLDRNVVVSYE